jgi:putative flippase GtrA
VSGATTFATRVGAAARHPGNWVQVLKFGIVGGSGYLINLAVFALLANAWGVQHLVAAVAAFCVALGNNYFWNRHWTFGPGEGPMHFQAARFVVVSVGALLINLVALELLVRAGVSELPSQAIAVAVAMPFNFLGNRLWTFR